MYILGINAAYHESSVCLLRDGELVSALEEERLNRIKHAKNASTDNSAELPNKAIALILKNEGITLEDIDIIGYSLNPNERLKTFDAFNDDIVEKNSWGTSEGEKVFYNQINLIPESLQNKGFKGRFLWIPHHHCHAGSAYYLSNFSSSAVLVLDGIGELSSGGVYLAKDNKIKQVDEFLYPASIGFLWEKFAQFLGFSEYDACKIMGLSAYGDASIYQSKFDDLVQLKEGGQFSIDNAIVQFRSDSFTSLETLFNTPQRECSQEISDTHKDIAAALQAKTEAVVTHITRHIAKTYDEENLCIAGGVALNCVVNSRILDSGLFNKLYIPAAAHDAGTSIGAAYWVWHMTLGNKRREQDKQLYLGPKFEQTEIKAALDQSKLNYTYQNNIEAHAAKLIADGNIISWFQGRMEFGPRGLGNRGILADPRTNDVRDLINKKIKHREMYRPFAPSILAEQLESWYEVKQPSLLTDYMLLALNIRQDKKCQVPGVLHYDDSSRVQTVCELDNPKYYNLIKAFYDLSGIPLILNTSFNDQEPIVCTPEDAINTYLKTELDYLVIGNYCVSRK